MAYLQEFRRNIFNTDSVDEALDLLDFCYKIIVKSGLSENGTYLPKAIHPKYNCIKPKTSMVSRCSTDSSCYHACYPVHVELHLGVSAFAQYTERTSTGTVAAS